MEDLSRMKGNEVLEMSGEDMREKRLHKEKRGYMKRGEKSTSHSDLRLQVL